MKKTYVEFKQYVAEHIKESLSEEYQDYDIKEQHILNSRGEYDALMVTSTDKGMNIAPALNLTQAYESYGNGKSLDEVIEELADIRMNATIPTFDKNDLFKWETVKDRVFPRLINTEFNEEYLKDKPRVDMADLSIVFAVRISEDERGFADAVITKDLSDMWGIDVDTIREQAIANLTNAQALFVNIEKMLFGMVDTNIDFDGEMAPFYVLTNKQKTKGASMVFNKTLMNEVVDRLGEVYIIPSSVDELLVVPQSECDDINRLRDMVLQVNESEVRPEDKLSDNIYSYDRETNSLVCVS